MSEELPHLEFSLQSSQNQEETVIIGHNKFRCFAILLGVVFSCSVIAYAISLAWINEDIQTVPCNIPGPRAVTTLKFLIVVSRHGNRMPLKPFPNDLQYPLKDTAHSHYGFGQLTTYGKVQMYKLGMKIRSLYNGFLKPQYYRTDLYAASTPIDRTMMSAAAFLAGVYPPTDFQIWNKSIPWQPIPVYSNSSDKSMEHQSCKKFMDAHITSLKKYEEQNVANLTVLNKNLNLYAGLNSTQVLHILNIWDTLICGEIDGYALPEWAKKMYPHQMYDLIRKFIIAAFAKTYPMKRLFIGPFIKETIEIMQSKVHGTLVPDRQMYYYSGHDTSLVSLHAALDVPESSIPLVMPGSAMIYEIHQDPSTDNFSVLVLYIDGRSADLDPVPINIPSCIHPCDFNSFVSITQGLYNITNYDEECQPAA